MKLHLGCGWRELPGYVHVDIARHPHIDHVHDIGQLPMFDDDSADIIYCCHAFEYFDRNDGLSAMIEWKRVLKPGGVLRLSVPDFAALITAYCGFGLKCIMGPLFGRMGIPNTDEFIYHKTVYDSSSLKNMFSTAGFVSVREWDSHWEYPDHDDFSKAYIPHMDRTGIQISLNMEAIKP
jgi:predicted SAM-dependent methyltransferase